MLTIIDTIYTVFLFSFCMVFIRNFYSMRDKLIIRIPVCVGIVLIRSALHIALYNHLYPIKLVTFFMIVVICTVILFRCDKFKFLLCDILFLSVVILSETIAVILLSFRYNLSVYEFSYIFPKEMLSYVCSTIITFLAIAAANIIVRKKFRKVHHNFTGYELAFYILIVIFELFVIYTLPFIFRNQLLDKILLVLVIGFSILNLTVYFMFLQLAESRRIEEENRLMKQQSEMQLKAYEKLSEQYNESLSFVHDMRKHIRSFDSLIECSTNAQVKEYQQRLYGELNRFYPNFRNDNQMLAVIINNEITKAAKLGIEIVLNIEKVDLNFIAAIDMTTIFCNLIDNAIEACCEAEGEQKIKISIIKQMNYITINIKNPYKRINRTLDNQFQTTKDGHLGLGLNNVRKAVEQYDGNLNININNNIFTVTAIFQVKE